MDEHEPYAYLEGKVADVMSTDPVIIHEDQSIKSLTELIIARKYHGLPVVNEEGKIIGIVRDTEVLSMFASREPYVAKYRTVKDIMHAPPFTIAPDETIQRAVMKMFADGTRILVVADKKQGMVGVVTRIDLIRGIRWRPDAE